MLLRHIFAVRNGDIVAFLFRYLFGNIDIVTFFLGHFFIFGNINVFARLVRDLLAVLFVVVGGLALFGVSSVTLLFLLIGSFVDSLALLLVFFSTFLFVSGFTILLFLISTFFFVFGNAFGYFNLFANLVVFCFEGSLIGSNFFLAFPVLFLARLVELNIVAPM